MTRETKIGLLVGLAFIIGAYSVGLGLSRTNLAHKLMEALEDVKLPEGKKLIPGVVTHHTNVVEHPELVAERLTRLAKLVGRENVLAGLDRVRHGAHERLPASTR